MAIPGIPIPDYALDAASDAAMDASNRVGSYFQGLWNRAQRALGLDITEEEAQALIQERIDEAFTVLRDASPANGGMDIHVLNELLGAPEHMNRDAVIDQAEYLMAAFSQLSYAPLDETFTQRMDELGYDIVTIEQNNIEVFVAMERDTGVIFTSFRGTDSTDDMLRNFQASQTPLSLGDGETVNVHTGYYTALNDGNPSVAQRVEDAIAAFQEHSPEREQPVLVTGHSAGGGYASIFALQQQAQETPITFLNLCNPGPVGDRKLCEVLDADVSMTVSQDDRFTQFMQLVYRGTDFTTPIYRDEINIVETEGSWATRHSAGATLAYLADDVDPVALATALNVSWSGIEESLNTTALAELDADIQQAAFGARNSGVVGSDGTPSAQQFGSVGIETTGYTMSA